MRRPWTSLRRFLSFPTRSRTIVRRQPTRQRLLLESLEDRIVPTIVFEPFFGAETTYYGGGQILGDTPVYLLYWGSYWTSGTGAAQESQLTTALQNEFNSAIYGRVGASYGAGPAYELNTWNANETGDPVNGFSDAALQNVVSSAINDLSSPILSPNDEASFDGGNPPIYLVITPPGISSGAGSGVLGYHSNYFGSYYDGQGPEDTFYSWVGSSNSALPNYNVQDLVTMVTSHEVGEALTNPNAGTAYDGWYMTPGSSWPYGGGIGEIGDFEPEFEPNLSGSYTSYEYRINGSLTQALWDYGYQAYTVSDGTAQNFYIFPQYQYNGSYYVYTGNELEIDGDQLGANDNITLDSNGIDTVTVTLNGETATFEPGQITSIVVYTGTGNNTVNINSTLYGAPVTIYGGSGNDNYVLAPSSDFLDNIQGAVTIHAGTGSNTLTVDDQADPYNGDTYTIATGSIQRTAEALISYSGIDSVTVNGSSTANITYEINSTAAGTPLTVNAGSGTNVVDLTPTSENLNNLAGAVTVNGGSTTTVNVDDQHNTASSTYTVTASTVSRSGFGGLTYAGLGTLVLNGDSHTSTWNINSTAAGTSLTVNSGSGTNTFNLAPTTKNLNNLAGAVTINASGSATTVNVDDQSNSAVSTYTVTATNVSRSTFGGLTYAGVHALVVNGGSAADTYNIQSTAAGSTVTVKGGAANDIFNLGSGNSLNNIKGALTVSGGGGSNTLNANDSSSATGQSYTLSSTKLTRTGVATITYSGLHALNVTASGSDTLTLLTPVPTVATTFNGGSGTNTLVGANATNTWTISGNNSGKVSSVTFSNFQNLVGGTGVDTFKFSTTSGKVLSINGGGAPAHQGDWLNYAAFGSATTVTVNLATGSATNVNGGAAGAVTNIQDVLGSATGTNNLTGSSQGNILIGGSGNNTLVGGSGNSLLIGGSGHGTITGGSGTDILIAGTTTYNAGATAGQNSLMAILAELQSADTFAQKVSDIINGNNSGGGSDLNGTNKLTWGVSGATVKASTGAFTLSGDSGASSNPDWFFSQSPSTVSDFNDDGVHDEHNNNAIGVF